MRIASYNLRKCVGLDRRRDPGRSLQVINALHADIVALQEADRRLGARPAALSARLIAENSDMRAVPTGRDGPSLGWHGNAILLRKGLTAGPAVPIDLPGTEPRGALSLWVEGELRIVATHLGLLRRDRRRQLAAIVSAVAGDAPRTVVLGDFNEWSGTRGLEPLRESFDICAPGNSFHAARPVATLDRIALGTQLELVDAGVCDTRLSRIASDHLPVWADVALGRARPSRARGRPEG